VIDWLLSGLTVTVQPEATVLTCLDVARVAAAYELHDTLTAALHALELPDVLVIQLAPPDPLPAFPPEILAAARDGSLGTLLRGPLPKLSDAEARTLLAQVQAGQAAQERQQALTHPSADLATALAQAVTTGRAAWELLILAHLRVVVSAARRHPSVRVTLEERVQAGLLGMLQAVARSDGRLTEPFALLAYRMARNAVQAALQASQPFKRTSSGSQVTQAQRHLRATLGRRPGGCWRCALGWRGRRIP
jgi:hypothetical protein